MSRQHGVPAGHEAGHAGTHTGSSSPGLLGWARGIVDTVVHAHHVPKGLLSHHSAVEEELQGSSSSGGGGGGTGGQDPSSTTVTCGGEPPHRDAASEARRLALLAEEGAAVAARALAESARMAADAARAAAEAAEEAMQEQRQLAREARRLSRRAEEAQKMLGSSSSSSSSAASAAGHAGRPSGLAAAKRARHAAGKAGALHMEAGSESGAGEDAMEADDELEEGEEEEEEEGEVGCDEEEEDVAEVASMQASDAGSAAPPRTRQAHRPTAPISAPSAAAQPPPAPQPPPRLSLSTSSTAAAAAAAYTGSSGSMSANPPNPQPPTPLCFGGSGGGWEGEQQQQQQQPAALALAAALQPPPPSLLAPLHLSSQTPLCVVVSPTPPLPFLIPKRHLRFGGMLGHGSYGCVCRGSYMSTPVAIKLLANTGWMASPEDKEDFYREAQTTFNARHDNVVLLHGVCVQEEEEEEEEEGEGRGEGEREGEGLQQEVGQGAAMEEDTTGSSSSSSGTASSGAAAFTPPPGPMYAMVMGLADGDLADAAAATGASAYSTRALLYILASAGQGLAFLHASGLVHRDIKPSNILIKGERGHERGLVGDLGLAKVRSSARRAASSFAGTLVYSDPAVLQGAPQDYSSDVYSYAVAAWEALSGRKAYAELDASATTVFIERISKGHRPDMAQLRADTPVDVRAAIAEAWAPAQSSRPTMTALAHRFLTALHALPST